MLRRSYGELSWHEMPSLGLRMLMPSPQPEILYTEKGNVVVRMNQLPGAEPGFGHMFFIGIIILSEDHIQARWGEAAEEEQNSFSKWLAERHDTCDLRTSPWMVSMRRDMSLLNGSWIKVSAMIHAYDTNGEPHIVPEDVTLAKRMIESIEILGIK